MRRGFIPVLFLLAAFLLGGWITYRLFNKRGEERTTVESSVLLERVREVFKLVTVEGDFSEIYHEKSIREVTLYLPIPTYWDFSKEALLEVKGKVLVGYNMEQVAFTVDSTTRTITLSNLPEPEILAVDHSITYRNLDESYFNSFTPEDYTQLNKNAKAILRKKAEESDLLAKAKADGNAMVETMRFMTESVGWTLKVNPPSTSLPSLNTSKN
jgi:hypothetical protein